jgi:cobalt-zinc-cadmium resistance protein CzcA
MIGALVRASVSHRFLVFLAVVLLAVVGVRSYLTLPIDAVPDITSVQVQVLTSAPGLSPLEVEQLVTRPVELAMTGIPGTNKVRSISRAAVSAVTIVFDDDVDPLLARQLVSQKLPAAREAVPASAERPEMGPFTTGLGEVYHFTLRWPGHDARDLRTLLDWDIALPLRTVPGVVEVNGWGGEVRQIEARLRPDDLRALGVSERDVEEALLGAGKNAGGGAVERGEEQVLVRLDGQYRSLDDVARQVVGTREGGVPIYVRDVATVQDGAAFRQSAATSDGRGETVYGMVQMIAGGNANEVVGRIKTKLDAIRERLPEGVIIEPFYDRAALVNRVLATVKRSLLEGGGIVIVVLFILLGDAAAGVVVATAIPLAMLGAFAMMRIVGLSGNLMSLGAIDFGLVVDGAVVVVEGALATMAAQKISAREALEREGEAVGAPIAFGVFIIGVVYLPILLLEGVEGKMFRPMAWTVLFAIGTALVLTFTWIPTLASMLLRRTHAHEAWAVRQARRIYAPLLERLLRHPRIAVLLAFGMLALGVAATWGTGAEFIPRLEEGDLVVQVTRPSSVSLPEAVRGTGDIERTLLQFPEVRRVVSRTGSPDVATDIMGVEMSDVFILLKPQDEWTSASNREALVGLFDRALRKTLPGTSFSFTQPIEMRTQELLGGIRSDVGVKIFGDDLATLRTLAEQVAGELSSMSGAADVRIEPTVGLPLATIRPDPEKMGRLRVSPEDVFAAVEAMRTGRTVGVFVHGERRFDVVVRSNVVPEMQTADLARYPIPLASGRTVLLGDVTDLRVNEGPAQVSREDARRRILVESNVRGRDLASFVHELEERLDRIPKPVGYYATVGGQYENLTRASSRLAVVVPATLVGIFVLLYMTFRNLRAALLIFLNVPVAASGGLVALAVRGLPLSISAAVGMIALFGVATLNGVVLLSSIRHHEAQKKTPFEAARDAAHERLRPVMTTALVASLGFIPMAIATGTGAEVQRPLATVVIGGLVTATVLTLGVLPALYARLGRQSGTAA